MARLSLSLLGHFQVSLDGETVTGFESKKVRALLAYLAVEADRPHAREVLAGLLWPDFPERYALSNVRYALSNLRKVIGDRAAQPPYLLITPEALQFNRISDYALDMQAFMDNVQTGDFSRLGQTVSLYRGEFLEGFAIEDSTAYEDWITLKRAQLSRKMLQALHRLTNHCLEHGDYEQAQQYAWRIVELEPWQEEGNQLLMRILALNGQRSAALAQYETCRRLLASELGVEPGEETTALYERIRNGNLVSIPLRVAQPGFLNKDAPSIADNLQICVAREPELDRLNQFLDRALMGNGQVAFVTGEPGSGKTILMHEFARRACTAHPELLVVNGNCNAYTGIGDPYLPFLEIMAMLTGDIESKWVGGTVTREHARRLWAFLPYAIQGLLDNGPDLIDRFVPASALLTRAESGAPSQVDRLKGLLNHRAESSAVASIQQADLFEQFTKLLQALSRKQPLLLVIDDLQWADSGSLGLLFHLGRLLAGHRILLMGAYRPSDVARGYAGERHPLEPIINELQRQYGEMRVDLSKVDGSRFVEAFLETEPNRLDDEFRQALSRHTGGHPLFVVELIHDMQARGYLEKDELGRWVEVTTLDWEILPPRVEAVIAESIQRLPEALQTMLAIASIEGETFTAQAVARIQHIEEGEVIRLFSGTLSKQHQLVLAIGFHRVVDRQIAIYRFRHFLFQKYLYTRFDDIERAHLHESMGEALETLYGEQSPQIALQLAWHFENARLPAKAVKYLQIAGDQAARLYANAEAISHYRHALDLLQILANTPERANLELRLRTALGVILVATRGFGDSEVEQNYGRARELTKQSEITPELFQVLIGLKGYFDVRGSLHVSYELGEDTLKIAEQLKDTMLQSFAWHSQSTTTMYLGHLMDFLDYRRRSNEFYAREAVNKIRQQIFQLGYDPEVAGLSHAGWAYWMLGYPEQARRKSDEAIAWAEELGHPYMIAWARFFAAQLYCYMRVVPITRKLAEETIDLSQEMGWTLWLTGSDSLLGWVLAEEGRTKEGISLQQQALRTYSMSGAEYPRLQEIPLLADTYAKAGMIADGLMLLEEALDMALSKDLMIVVPDLYRCKGELLFHSNKDEAAEDCFQQSIEAARRMEAKSLELRAALSLCRLWRRNGKSEAAFQRLSSIYSWFTEGFDTPDLIEARQLLDELAHP